MRNRGAEWSDEDIRRLRDLAAGGTPTRVIALRLDRSKAAVSLRHRGSSSVSLPQFLKENEVMGNSHI